jgi:DNA-binding NarL/FixJ family response regulator
VLTSPEHRSGTDRVAEVGRTLGRGGDLRAIVNVQGDEPLLDPTSTARMLNRLREQASRKDPLAALSDQERRILELIGEGMTNRQIGEHMFLAEKTIKNYVSNLLAKLDMQRRTQAAALAAQLKTKGGRQTGT